MCSKSPRLPTPSFVGGDTSSVFYGFDMTGAAKGLLSGLLLGDIWEEIPTYLRNGNSTIAYKVDSSNAVTNADV